MRCRHSTSIIGCATTTVLAGLLLAVRPTGAATTAASPPLDEDAAVVIDFEDAPAGLMGTPVPELGGHYASLEIAIDPDLTALVVGEESSPALPDVAHSGSTVATDCYAEEFCTNDIEVVFLRRRMALVEVWVGDYRPRDEDGIVLLEAFDEDAAVMDTDEVLLPPSDGPTPVDEQLVVTDDDGAIAAIRISWLEGPSDGLLIDDLRFVPMGTPPAAEPGDDGEPQDAEPQDTGTDTRSDTDIEQDTDSRTEDDGDLGERDADVPPPNGDEEMDGAVGAEDARTPPWIPIALLAVAVVLLAGAATAYARRARRRVGRHPRLTVELGDGAAVVEPTRPWTEGAAVIVVSLRPEVATHRFEEGPP